MIKICGYPLSNYFNKVRLVAAEMGIEHEVDATVSPSQDAALLARSPMGKIPFLETEQGLLCESQIICDYLAERFPDKALYPADPFARAKVRELNQVLELHIELVARRAYGAVFFGGSLSDDTKHEIKRDLDKGLRAFLHLAKFAPYVAGSDFTLVYCSAALHFPIISMVTTRLFGQDLFAGVPQMADYLSRVNARPTVQKVCAERDQAFARVMAARQKS